MDDLTTTPPINGSGYEKKDHVMYYDGKKIDLRKVVHSGGTVFIPLSQTEKNELKEGKIPDSKIPNAEIKRNYAYILEGYNLFKMNPYRMTEDRGCIQSIFEKVTSRNNKKDYLLDTSAGFYFPCLLKYEPLGSYDKKAQKMIASSSEEEAKSFEQKLSLDVSKKGLGSFSANGGWKNESKRKVENSTMTRTLASVAKEGRYTLTDFATFKDYFVTDLKKLGTNPSGADYKTFFTNYGTHFTTQITIGADAYSQETSTKNSIKEAIKNKWDLKAQLNGKAKMVKIDASSETNSFFKENKAFNNSSNRFSWTIRGKKDGNIITKVEDIGGVDFSGAVVVNLRLVPIYELFAAFEQNSTVRKVGGKDKKEIMKQALEVYRKDCIRKNEFYNKPRFPKDVVNELLPFYAGEFDAVAYNHSDERYWFFRGKSCWSKKRGNHKVSSRKKIQNEFAGLPHGKDLDAAVYAKGKYYFFIGKKCYMKELGNSNDVEYVGTLASMWGIDDDRLNMAVYNALDECYYFFKDNGGVYKRKYGESTFHNGTIASAFGLEESKKYSGVAFNNIAKAYYFFSGKQYVRKRHGRQPEAFEDIEKGWKQ